MIDWVRGMHIASEWSDFAYNDDWASPPPKNSAWFWILNNVGCLLHRRWDGWL